MRTCCLRAFAVAAVLASWRRSSLALTFSNQRGGFSSNVYDYDCLSEPMIEFQLFLPVSQSIYGHTYTHCTYRYTLAAAHAQSPDQPEISRAYAWRPYFSIATRPKALMRRDSSFATLLFFLLSFFSYTSFPLVWALIRHFGQKR